VALLVSLPLVALALLTVWLQDGANPFYVAERVGVGGRRFWLLKIRTMVPNAADSAVDTTVAGDPRVTVAGRWIRAGKLDELPQFLHVLTGRMSLVGPRPNVPREVALYTAEEQRLLSVRPGITDLASVVFADLAEALQGAHDPNIAYNQLVRPWKNRLALWYLGQASAKLDLLTIFYTLTVSTSRRWTLQRISNLLRERGAEAELCRFVLREDPLRPMPPPGTSRIVTTRSPR